MNTSTVMYGVPSLRERIKRLGVAEMVDIKLAEEQKQVSGSGGSRGRAGRHIERPPKTERAHHVILQDIFEFVYMGNCPGSLGTPRRTSSSLFPCSNGKRLTVYLRPLNWIFPTELGKDNIVDYQSYRSISTITMYTNFKLHLKDFYSTLP